MLLCTMYCADGLVEKLAGIIYSTISIGIEVVNVGVSNSSCFFIFSIFLKNVIVEISILQKLQC